jgi:hypothetical protein
MQKGDLALVVKLTLFGAALVAVIALIQGLPTSDRSANQQALEANGAESG